MDFINQAGDIKLDLNIEYRTHLFWKLNGAAFVDAGNIWTIRDDSGQEGGLFKFNEFYKQIAVAYGLGIRLDLDYLILRFDGGMKAINPVETGKKRYPVIRPRFSRDFAFHFAVGYPFKENIYNMIKERKRTYTQEEVNELKNGLILRNFPQQCR